MIYKRSSTSPRLTFADERISSPPQAVSRQTSVARSVTEENIKTAASTSGIPKVNSENHDTDAASAKMKTEQEGTAAFNGAIPR